MSELQGELRSASCILRPGLPSKRPKASAQLPAASMCHVTCAMLSLGQDYICICTVFSPTPVGHQCGCQCNCRMSCMCIPRCVAGCKSSHPKMDTGGSGHRQADFTWLAMCSGLFPQLYEHVCGHTHSLDACTNCAGRPHACMLSIWAEAESRPRLWTIGYRQDSITAAGPVSGFAVHSHISVTECCVLLTHLLQHMQP